MNVPDPITTRRSQLAFRASVILALAIGAIALWPILTIANRCILEQRIQSRVMELQGSWTGTSDPFVPRTERTHSLAISNPLNSADVKLLSSTGTVIHLSLPGTGITDQDVEQLLEGMPRIESLDLSDNALTDVSLTSIAALSKLEDLRLNRVTVSASGLAHLTKLSKLESLGLCKSSLSAAAMQELGKSSVVSLHLEGCQLEEAGLGHLPGIQCLWLRGTNTSDDGIEQLARVANLEMLDLGQTAVTGRSLLALRSMTKLRWLRLSETAIVDGDLQHLVYMPQLKALFLDHCDISDDSVDDLLQFTKLESLYMGRTKLTDSGLLRLAGMPALKSICIDESTITEEGRKQFTARCPDVGIVVWDE